MACAEGARVAEQFARQLGLITLEQARRLGLTRGLCQSRLRQGRWHMVAHGVYRLVGSPATWDQRALAACLAAGPRAALSHDAAAAVLGLGGVRRQVIEISVPARHRATAASGLATVHRPRHLEPVDLAKVGLLTVTTPARTVIDQAARLSASALARLVDEVLCRRLTSRRYLLGRLDTLTGPGRAGSGPLRDVLEVWASGPPADGVAEMDLLRLLAGHGLPQPERQYQVVHEGKVVARVDLAWPQHRVALELDSERWHGGGVAYHRDKARQLRIAAARWQTLAVTPRNLAEGGAGDLVAALRERLGC